VIVKGSRASSRGLRCASVRYCSDGNGSLKQLARMMNLKDARGYEHFVEQ
jgi:hypothetical protein